ncbi:MAG: type II toxin-antitoxin system RelB/DinJ family antitoxin [Eggerthellaceae bacterium]|jgi:DNA-damage-inducible protein J|nr:type II toxin-antitoxin system RelB/DinJ family antitoxin [Eggerthellaceae bacterium]
MAKTADLKLRIDPELKKSAVAVYDQWGLNLTDAVTMFLHQSVAVGGLPFAMRMPRAAPSLDWESPDIRRIDPEAGHAILPAEWDSAEDAVYDSL